MSTWLQTTATPSEYIQKAVKNPSIMLGKDRTILKSFTTGRSVGYFRFFVDDSFPDAAAAVFPLTPADGLAYVNAIYEYTKTIYTAQRQHHLEIDPIIYTGTIPLFNAGEYAAVNHPMAILFRDNGLLPPNKNVYFRILSKPPYQGALPYYNFVQGGQGIIFFDNAHVITNFHTNIFAGVITPANMQWEPVLIKRTDANGKIPDMTQKFTALTFPFDNKDFFQRTSQTLTAGLPFEIREIKDRYDCDEGSFKFIPRRYQALVDNEWEAV